MKESRAGTSPLSTKPWASLLPWAFIACFVLSALLAQWVSDVEPWAERAPIEYFTGGLLWMLAAFCLLLALSWQRDRRRFVF